MRRAAFSIFGRGSPLAANSKPLRLALKEFADDGVL